MEIVKHESQDGNLLGLHLLPKLSGIVSGGLQLLLVSNSSEVGSGQSLLVQVPLLQNLLCGLMLGGGCAAEPVYKVMQLFLKVEDIAPLCSGFILSLRHLCSGFPQLKF